MTTSTNQPIFNDPRVLPEENRELILVCVDGQFIAPVRYCAADDAFHSIAGTVKPYMIHQWAYVDELFTLLGLPKVDPDLLDKLKQRAKRESNDKDKAEKIFEALMKAMLKVPPEEFFRGEQTNGFRRDISRFRQP